MVWLGAGLAVLLAVTTAAFTAAILRSLPTPQGEPDALPYSALISPGLLVTVLVCCLAALALPVFFASPATWPVWAVLGTVGVLLAVIDAHTGFLPLRLTWAFGVLAALAVGATAWLRNDPVVLLVALLCGAGAWILFLLFWRIGGGLGFGDVRLVAIIAGAAGADSVELATWSLVMGGLAGVVWGTVTRIRRGADEPFPYGPSLVIGPFAALAVRVLLG